ncbi:MAG: cysteine methyltransferase [Acidobacteria bacterium]|jgi:methylated-DNA-protein-cysteine methyltransferase related protein|nr:MAG: cysteine methyltransferase [Acidobacteriota bacterium]
MDSAIIRNEIYRIVRKIPRGSVLSYGDIGRIVGTGPRQVAAAMRACPAGLPWHRVVGAGGTIRTPGEYAWIQRERLIAEGIRFRGRGFSYDLYRWKTGKYPH